MRRYFAALLLIFLVFVAVLLVTPWGQDVFLAGLLLQEMTSGREGLLSAWTARPRRETVALRRNGREFHADLYLPSQAEGRGGILLLHGLDPEGRRHPQLVHLANSLARARRVVLVPDLHGLKHLRMRAEDTRDVIRSFQYLESRSEVVRDALGIVGISIGAGPGLIAAAHPTIRDRVRVVVSLGGYADLGTVVTFVTTGHYSFKGVEGYVPPRDVVRLLFLHSNMDMLPAADREEIQALLRAGPLPSVPPASLSREGKALYRLVVNRTAAAVPALLSALPSSIRREIEELSPITQLHDLRAEVFLLHGIADPLVPHTESLMLYEVLRDRGNVHLILLRLFQHVEPVDGVPVSEALTFYRFLFQVLRRLS
ncbi:MAG: hypothetical protein V3W05_06720 [candidate division NC10 bacterium]